MKQYVIYQLPVSNPCIFREELAKPSDYVAVYREVLPKCLDCETSDLLEFLFNKFNNSPPPTFAGHSLSVSDIVAIVEQDDITNATTQTLWQCRTVGWKQVEFNEEAE